MGSTIMVNGSGNVTTDFMKVAGFPKSTSTPARPGLGQRADARGLALDITGSMADDGKMAAMKTAAKALIDQLSALAKNPGDIYISIVPFAKDVNVGASNYNQTWIDWTDWDAANGNAAPAPPGTGAATARARRGRRPTTTTGPAASPTATRTTTPRTRRRRAAQRVPGRRICLRQRAILQAAIALSAADHAAELRLDDAEDARSTTLEPTGNTNQGIGMAWALDDADTRAIRSTRRPKDPNYIYKDAIILLSDGFNTQNRWYSNANRRSTPARRSCATTPRPPASRSTRSRSTPAAIRPRGAAILRQRRRQILLSDHLGQPDRDGLQRDRHVALEAARREISSGRRANEKSPALRPGFLILANAVAISARPA